MKFGMARRDAWWSVFLHEHYGQESAVDRLVDWAWSPESKGKVDGEAIRLCAITLTWFLTTSNRYLRDRSTKALVSILKDRMRVLREVILDFLNVNDPYVLERLFAVAYGCALCSKNNEQLARLAEEVYEWIFKKGNPPVHILLRDYARGVIEVALHRNLNPNVDIKKIRPPYASTWPEKIPSKLE